MNHEIGKPKLSKLQKINLLHTFLLINHQLFDGGLEMDGNYHVNGVSPVTGNPYEFLFALEKDGQAGSVGLKTILDVHACRISAEYHIVLTTGATITGTLEQLEGFPDRIPITTTLSKMEAATILTKTTGTNEGLALSKKYAPSDEQYKKMEEELKRRWGQDFVIESKEEVAARKEIQKLHEHICATYVFQPGVDGNPRQMNRDEQLMISFLFAQAAIKEMGAPPPYYFTLGEVLLHPEKGCSYARAAFFEGHGAAQHIGIEVTGPLNKAEDKDIEFFCVSPDGEYIHFDSIAAALQSGYSTGQPQE